MNSKINLYHYLFILLFFMFGCMKAIEMKPIAFKNPSQYQNCFEIDNFKIAFVPILDKKSSIDQFNVNFGETSILPVRIIIENKGQKEILVDARQIFGVTAAGDFYQSYDLDQSTRIIRRSQIGESMATGAAVGALAGTLVGVGLGAGVGYAAGGSADIGRGAGAGAIIGGTAGAASGMVAGADEIEKQVRREMRRADWGAQVVYTGEIKLGYIFFPREYYNEIALNVYDLIEKKSISGAVPFHNK